MPKVHLKRAGRCPQCFFRPAFCLCPTIPTVNTSLNYTIIRHWADTNSPTNTGRLADLAMPSLTLHDYGHLDVPPFSPDWLPSGPLWLLFPPEEAHPPPPTDAPPPSGLVILDGTWRHVRRMVRRNPTLQHLPRFTPPVHSPDRQRIRQPPFPGGLATLEAIAAAVSVLEGPEVAQPLDDLFDRFVRQIRAQRGY